MAESSLEEIVKENERLVHYVAKRYRKWASKLMIDYDDLISEGMIGLIKAVKRFDESYGVKFSTYAVPMVEGQIKRILRDTNVGPKFVRSAKDLSFKLIGDESVEDVMEKHQVKRHLAEEALKYKSNDLVYSLDKSINNGEDKDTEFSNYVGVYDDYSSMDVNDFLNFLPEKEQMVVKGIIADKSQTEIGKLIGCSQVQVSRYLKHIRKLYTKYMTEGDKGLGKLEMTVDEFVDMRYVQNLSFVQIGKMKGVSDPTIHHWKNNHATEIEEALKRLQKKAVNLPVDKPKEVKTIQDSIEVAFDEKYSAEKSEYERLIQSLKSELQEASSLLKRKDELIQQHEFTIQKLENRHETYQKFKDEIDNLQEENQAMRALIKKWA